MHFEPNLPLTLICSHTAHQQPSQEEPSDGAVAATKIKGERGTTDRQEGCGRVQGKGEGPRANWEKVQVVWICRGVGVVPSRVIRDEYRIWGLQNDRLVFSNKPD